MDNREKGYTLFKKGLKNKEIAEKLGVSESAVKNWANRYWKNKKAASLATTKDAATPHAKSRGAPRGNVNAVGNKGGAPPRNQNAFKHGGYAAILFEQLDGQEQALIEQMTTDEEQMLIDEINLLTVRERRFMQRIQQAQESPLGAAGSVRIEHKREFDTPEDEALYHERIQEKIDEGKQLPGREYTTHTTTEASYSIVLKLEEALTQCQAQKQRAIDTLNKIRMAKGDGKTRDIEDMLIIRKVVFGADQTPDT